MNRMRVAAPFPFLLVSPKAVAQLHASQAGCTVLLVCDEGS